uniref:Uncharacterized protein n=1 Tax=Anguilla anguilla TaxID=7936 RepID=A0A0E9PL93_ANGAN
MPHYVCFKQEEKYGDLLIIFQHFSSVHHIAHLFLRGLFALWNFPPETGMYIL